jgi:hypothetical protein
MDIRLKESIVKQLEIELQTSLQIAEQYNIIITIYNEKPIVIEKKAILGSNVIRFIKNNIDKIDNINNTGHSILLFNKSNNANSVFLYCLIPNNELNNIIKEINTLNNKKIDYKIHFLLKYLAFYNKKVTIYSVKNNLDQKGM